MLDRLAFLLRVRKAILFSKKSRVLPGVSLFLSLSLSPSLSLSLSPRARAQRRRRFCRVVVVVVVVVLWGYIEEDSKMIRHKKGTFSMYDELKDYSYTAL